MFSKYHLFQTTVMAKYEAFIKWKLIQTAARGQVFQRVIWVFFQKDRQPTHSGNMNCRPMNKSTSPDSSKSKVFLFCLILYFFMKKHSLWSGKTKYRPIDKQQLISTNKKKTKKILLDSRNDNISYLLNDNIYFLLWRNSQVHAVLPSACPSWKDNSCIQFLIFFF